MLRKIIVILTFVICGECMASEKSKKSEISDQEERVDKIVSIIKEYERKIKETKNIQLKSYGFMWTGPDKVYNGKIHGINRGYCVDKNLKFDAARKLFYEIVDGLIQAINVHPEIGDAFYHFPIGYQNLKIGLSFDYEMKGYLKKDDIQQISIFENEIFYEVVDQEAASNDTEKKRILPNVYMTEGLRSKTHCIRKKLPENN